MHIQWKHYFRNLVEKWEVLCIELDRIFDAIHSDRDIDSIFQDYTDGRWISKKEMTKLYEYMKSVFIADYTRIQGENTRIREDYHLLLSNFNGNCLSTYAIAEEKMQGLLKKL